MAIKLTCPGCQDAVPAEDADRGKTIKCGTCWTDVDVPPAPVTAAPLPTARPITTAAPVPAAPVPAAPVPTATPVGGPKKAIPLPATPTAKPVPAVTPLKTATPVQPKGRDRRDDDGGKKPRFKERERRYDDEDEDDRPTRREAKKGGGGVLIAFIAVGAVVLLGTAGGIAVVVMNNKPTAAADPTTATDTPAPAPAPGPVRNPGDFGNPNPIPNQPPPKVLPLRPDGWDEFRGGQNFRCDLPGRVSTEPAKFDYATKTVTGTTYTAAEGNDAITVTVKELNLPGGTPATSDLFVLEAFGLAAVEITKNAKDRLVGGSHNGVEFSGKAADGSENTFLAVGVGRKAFLFRFQWKANAPQAEAKRANFLASVTVTLPAEDAVVVRPGEPENPNEPKPISAPWKPLDTKDGFTVMMPPGVRKPEKHLLEVERVGVLNGKKWVNDDGDVMYHVFYHDLGPDQLDIDLRKVAAPLVHSVFPYEVQGNGEETKVDGKPATRWDVREFNGNITHGVSVRVGYRVFTLFVTGMHNLKGPTVEDRQDRFLNSIKITFDPKTHDPYADEPAWVPVAKAKGFTALIPRQASTVAEFNPFFFPESPIGKEWKAEVDGIVYQVFVVDFSPNPKRNGFSDKRPPDLVKHFTDNNLLSGPEKAKLGTLDAEGYTLKPAERPSHLRFVAAGNLVYVAKTSREWGNKCGDKEFADKSARFFDTFRLGEGVIAQPGGGGTEPGGNAGEFARLGDAKVQPFWAGVFVAGKKEFVTFGVKDASARQVRGVVRRYSVPDFKLKATYETVGPVHRAAVDEAGGKLYVALVRDAADARSSEKDAAILSGDIQQYDLNKLTDGTLAEAEQLKPLTTVLPAQLGFRVSGLEVAADGSAVFVGGVVFGGTGKNLTPRSGRLMKWETATGKPAADINTDAPIRALAVGGDGKRVVGLERFLDPTRGGGNLVVVDGDGWKRTGTTPLAGFPLDVSVRGDRVAVALTTAATGGAGKLAVGLLDGELAEVNTGGEVHYVRFTPGGTRLLASAGVQSDMLALFDIDAGKPPKLTRVADAAQLGGLFVISPDGKLAVLNTGAVLDLEKSKAK